MDTLIFVLVNLFVIVYDTWGWGSPNLCRTGDGSPISYSYGDPIHIDRGPQTYEGVPISTIDMGMGVPISM